MALFSLSWASALTGVIQPIEEIARICSEKNVHLHVDGSYVIGKLNVEFSETGISFLTLDGEALHAGKTSGIILVKDGITFRPFETFQIDPGSFAAFVEGCRQMELFQDRMNLEVSRLRDSFELQIQKRIPNTRILFQSSKRLPNTSVIVFPGVHQESLLYALNEQKVYASFGGNAQQHLSNLLRHMGYPLEVAQSALSFSLSRYTLEEEIDQAVLRIEKQYQKLRSLSGEIALC